MVGTEETRLVVLRGNSASGKSSVAAGLRERFGRGLALVGQDNLRRIVLRERDRPGAANIGLIDLTARYALNDGFHVAVEGILYADRYGDMLAQLRAEHHGPTHGYYLDVPFGETLARHATKPIADDVSETQLRDWYRPRDLLPGGLGGRAALSPDHGWSARGRRLPAVAARHVFRCPGPVQRTRWLGSWAGRHTGSEEPPWSRSTSGAARTGTSRRKPVSAGSVAAPCRALMRVLMPLGPVPSRTNSGRGKSE
jgi:hypothetical protein